MSSSLLNSIVLVTSANPNINSFGTGFVIHQDEQATYILTCAHVVRDVGGPEAIQADGIRATLIVSGSVDDMKGPDLAVLQVPKLLDKYPLQLYASGEKGKTFVAAGFQLYSKQFLIRPLQGILGEQVAIGSQPSSLIKAWDLKITDDYQLQPGYSGSPAVDESGGNVLGVVSHRQGEGKKGLAISIEALREVWPELPPEVFRRPFWIEEPHWITVSSGLEQSEKAFSPFKSRTKRSVHCPSCAASITGAKRYFIDWNEKKKEFQIKIAYLCGPTCGYRFDEELVKRLPLMIAQHSFCSCGSELSLSDYSIRKVGGELELEAVYTCEACSLRKRSLISSLMRDVSNIWKNITRVDVDCDGLKYRKRGSNEE